MKIYLPFESPGNSGCDENSDDNDGNHGGIH